MSHQRRRGQPARIWKTITVTDRRGNKLAVASADGPYEVRAAFIPQRSSRAEVPGELEIDVVSMIVAPNYDDVTMWSRVEWRGEQWDIVTPPAYHHGTRRHTRHWSMNLRKRPVEVT